MKDPVNVAPWRAGQHGFAWKIDHAVAYENFGEGREDATLGTWIVQAEWAHPVWHSYFVALVHLRPMADARETILYRDDATHEFWIYAINPEAAREPMIKGAAMPALLKPGNFAAQLAETSDAAALSRIEGAIELIIAGELNPDTDAQRQWEALFGNAMIKPQWRATGG